MKKLLFLMMMLMGVINTSAQEKKEIQKMILYNTSLKNCSMIMTFYPANTN